jgi:hypothetical protein
MQFIFPNANSKRPNEHLSPGAKGTINKRLAPESHIGGRKISRTSVAAYGGIKLKDARIFCGVGHRCVIRTTLESYFHILSN